MRSNTNPASGTNNDEATIYVSTFPENNSPGHTSALVVNSNGESFSRSFFPSSRLNRHLLQAYLKIPVAGFNTKGPLSDVKYEGAAPYSILKIKGKFSDLQKEHEKYLADLEIHSYFSLTYNSHRNIFHWLTKAMDAHRDLNSVEATGFDPILTQYPTSDDLLSATPTPQKQACRFTNCAASVYHLLKAGGIFRQDNDKTYLSPKKLHEKLAALPGTIEMIDDLENLPEVLKKSVIAGEEYEINNHTPSLEGFRQAVSTL